MNVSERVLRALEDIVDTDEVRHDPDLRLFDEGVLDSLGTVQLIVALEGEFSIEILPAALDRETWSTPRQLIADVERRLASSSSLT